MLSAVTDSCTEVRRASAKMPWEQAVQGSVEPPSRPCSCSICIAWRRREGSAVARLLDVPSPLAYINYYLLIGSFITVAPVNPNFLPGPKNPKKTQVLKKLK